MPHRHRVSSREIGQIRIYVTPGERGKTKGGGLKRLLPATPLYMEVIAAAKSDNMMSATAHHSHYGYSGEGAIHAEGAESANPALTLVVEITGEREKLENFCRKHAGLLEGKTIIYKHLEHWELHANTLEEKEADVAEYGADEPEVPKD